MYYIIQENVFRESSYEYVFKALDRLGLEYEQVSLNKSDSFPFESDRKDVFCFGSVKLARIATQYGWTPGSLQNDNHDFEVYASYWKHHLLNGDSKIVSLNSLINFGGQELFIRPTKDSKTFTGAIFNETSWIETLKRIRERKKTTDEKIQIAKPKHLLNEIRCWIVNKKTITASTYKIGNEVRYMEYLDQEGISFANEMAQLYAPAEAFVLDICLTHQGWKVVEANCINSAGFYACDLQRLIIGLEDYFGR